jgi:hypothetical protein
MISRWTGVLALVCTSLLQAPPILASPDSPGSVQGKGRPKAVLRLNPSQLFLPQRLVATVELTEGAEDYQDYYCPKIEWIWGDGSQSASGEDCDPYEAGKSEIRRRFSADHNYRSDPASSASSYDIYFRMKQGSKVVLSLKQTVRVRGQ